MLYLDPLKFVFSSKLYGFPKLIIAAGFCLIVAGRARLAFGIIMILVCFHETMNTYTYYSMISSFVIKPPPVPQIDSMTDLVKLRNPKITTRRLSYSEEFVILVKITALRDKKLRLNDLLM